MQAGALPVRRKCTLGCPILDRCLAGGVPSNSITEIVAESGCGKTQLCLQLCICAQLPTSRGGLSASAIYLHTEFPFPSRRLHQLSIDFPSRFPHFSGSDPCDGIFVQSVHTAEELLDTIPKIESFLVNAKTRLPVGLIVIDSIAALFRSEFENTPSDLKRRASLFFKLSGKLKALAMTFDLALVMTNQVVDYMDSGEHAQMGNMARMFSSGRRVCPALGLAWANCVNTRLFLSRDSTGKRELHVAFAPHLPYANREFVIKREGVIGVEI